MFVVHGLLAGFTGLSLQLNSSKKAGTIVSILPSQSRSSAASIPLNIETQTPRRIGVPESIASFSSSFARQLVGMAVPVFILLC